MLLKIISGGQTGVDTAALDFARGNGIPTGGWVPKGRTNEAGKIPDYFDGMRETLSENVIERTRLNVVSSDATLIFIDGSESPGTDQTVDFAKALEKPFLVVNVKAGTDSCIQKIRSWMSEHAIETLNIAGPRESEAPGLARIVSTILKDSLARTFG